MTLRYSSLLTRICVTPSGKFLPEAVCGVLVPRSPYACSGIMSFSCKPFIIRALSIVSAFPGYLNPTRLASHYPSRRFYGIEYIRGAPSLRRSLVSKYPRREVIDSKQHEHCGPDLLDCPTQYRGFKFLPERIFSLDSAEFEQWERIEPVSDSCWYDSVDVSRRHRHSFIFSRTVSSWSDLALARMRRSNTRHVTHKDSGLPCMALIS